MDHVRTVTLATMVVFLATLLSVSVVEGIGVNWGLQASQNMHPNTIVQMLRDNKINQVKLFESDDWSVRFFANTGIEVMLGIPNNQLASLAGSYKNARNWVKNNVTKHVRNGRVNIRYVAVGNEPFLRSYNGSNLKTMFPALQNVQRALNAEGLGRIKATIPQNADVYESGSDGPSAGNFRSDIRDLMRQIVRFFRDNNTPFVVNIYPFLSLYENPDFPIEFAFFDGGARPVVDGDISYTNMLDANLDTLVWSLRKAGTPNVKIIIGEIGWPTDGNVFANVTMAQKFYDGFFKKMATRRGTPRYPGDMEVYLFSLTDENQKSIAPGDFERHWGVFKYDGQPKFPMDFSGRGNDRPLVGAKDVKYFEKQWCVFNEDIKIMTRVQRNLDFACSRSDCSSLTEGSSCYSMDNRSHASYAFNMYYQMSGQDLTACNFEGLARLQKTDPSTRQCQFPIAIQSSGWKVGVDVGASIVVGFLVFLSMLCK